MLQVICLKINLFGHCHQKLNYSHIRHHNHCVLIRGDRYHYVFLYFYSYLVMSSVITILIRRMKPKIRGGGAEGEVSRIQEQTGSSSLGQSVEKPRLPSGFALGQSLGPRGADRPRAQIHLATPEAFRQIVILSNFRKS